MSGTLRPFIRPADVSAPLDVVLVAPFRAFANKGKGLVELVFGTVALVELADVRSQNDLFAVADRVARPFSLKICGEGWIRLEQQLGRDVLTWENRGVTLYHATLARTAARPFDYVGITPWTTEQRAARFGRFA